MTKEALPIRQADVLVGNLQLRVPFLIAASGERATARFLEFFSSSLQSPQTRRAYANAIGRFFAWCDEEAVPSISAVLPSHVAAWIEKASLGSSVATANLHLAAIRNLFKWLVDGHIVPLNPSASMRGLARPVPFAEKQVLGLDEVAMILDSIDISSSAGLRDRALIALMLYTFARIGSALAMRVEDAFFERGHLWVRLHGRGGRANVVPCHPDLEAYLTEYLERTGIIEDRSGPLFRTVGRGTANLTGTELPQANAFAMIRRRAVAAGVRNVASHSFREAGIVAYLNSGGTLEKAAVMANHASARTTQVYDRRSNEVGREDFERIKSLRN